MNRSIAGTEIKVNVHFESIDGLTMDDYDFTCEFYVFRNMIATVNKKEMIRVDQDNYVAIVDTATTGPGEIMLRATAMIPDADCDGGYRKEVAGCSTGITIRR